MNKDINLIPDNELRQLAMDIVECKVFTDRAAPPELISNIFLIAALGGLAGVDPNQVGLIYEYIDKAGPVCVNGYPTFLSLRLLHRQQIPALADYIQELTKSRNDFLGVKTDNT